MGFTCFSLYVVDVAWTFMDSTCCFIILFVVLHDICLILFYYMFVILYGFCVVLRFLSVCCVKCFEIV